jgi:hypothetical protein
MRRSETTHLNVAICRDQQIFRPQISVNDSERVNVLGNKKEFGTENRTASTSKRMNDLKWENTEPPGMFSIEMERDAVSSAVP